MSNENKKKELKSSEGSKELEHAVEIYHDSYKTVNSFIKDAARLQRQLNALSSSEVRIMTDMVSTTLPALQEFARRMAIIDNSVYRSIGHMARVTASTQNDLQKMMKRLASVISDTNGPYIELAKSLSNISEFLKDTDAMKLDHSINLEYSIIAERNNDNKRIEALENALVRLEKELMEKDAENKELIQLIKELINKNKLTYVA